jgi:hypothetical protein
VELGGGDGKTQRKRKKKNDGVVSLLKGSPALLAVLEGARG